MADSTITNLTSIASATDTDVYPLDTLVAGVPTTKKISWALIKSELKIYLDTLYTAIATAIPYNGWVPFVGTWTYASATTFTITGDYTGILKRGMRVKYTQTTVKYGIINTATYSSPNTTVTLFLNSDYSIANAAITAPFYSSIDNPDGFPGVFNWVPVVTSTGGTPTTVTVGTCKYKITVGTVSAFANVTIVNKGTATGDVLLSIPWTNVGAPVGVGRENGVTGKQHLVYGDTTHIAIQMSDGTAIWTNSYAPGIHVDAMI